MPAQMNRLKSITALALPEVSATASDDQDCDQQADKTDFFAQRWLLLPDTPAQLAGPGAHNVDLNAWLVDPQRNMIQARAAGNQVVDRQLEPRVMHLLCLLANAEGNVVSREELMLALWPKVIVNENSLTRAMSELRKALATPALSGTDKSGVSLIETVSKKGYRLNASVHFGDVTDVSSPRNPHTSELAPGAGIGRYAQRWLASRSRLTVAMSTAIATAILSLLLSSGIFVNTDPSRLLASISASNSYNEAVSLADHVVSDAPDLPTGVQWLDSLHVQSRSASLGSTPWLNPQASSNAGLSILSPGGDLLAFVEELSGQSTLKLRSLNKPDEIWTAFTSASAITRLQWSPLEDGILFTVVDRQQLSTAALNDASNTGAYPAARLMLLDLHSLQVRELYRRERTDPVEPAGSAGSLT